MNFNDPSTIAVTRGHVAGLGWRFWQCAGFAIGAALVLDSFAAGLGWYLAVGMSMSFDQMLAKSYLDSRSERERQTAGLLFISGRLFTIVIFAAMTIGVAIAGGAPGQVLSVLMAASCLVGAALSYSQARAFMLISAAPCTISLLLAPLIPHSISTADWAQGAVGVAWGIVMFLSFLMRVAQTNSQLVVGLEAATKDARQRQIEADAKRADAEAANRAKSEFLTTMTHELRTPLNAVIGYAEMIGEDLESEGRKEMAEDAARIVASARHLLNLINQILHLSIMETGRAQLSVTEFSVRHLIEDAAAAAATAVKTSGNRLSIHVGAGVSAARTDRDNAALCLGHLLANAAKFTSGGLIAISAECEHIDGRDWLRIAVSDTGIGIKPEDVARAFQPLTQLDGSTTRAQGGMGMGLAIAKRMAQALGGDIMVASEPGKGSTFTLRVPLRLDEVKASEGELLLRRLGAAA